MDHRERLEHVIHREKADRVPVAFWRHFPVDDQEPESLAASTLGFQRQFDLDFVKVTPASSFCVKDWGMDDMWQGNPEGTREYLKPIISRPQEWAKLPKLNPKKGYLKAQIRCLDFLKKELPADTPFIQTIFSPLTQAKNLVGRDQLTLHLRINPDEVARGLETITQTTIDFIEECSKSGIDGIFFAEQYSSYDLLTKDEFLRFGKKYDEQIHHSASKFWLNVLHIHGQHIMFDQMVDFPYHIFNWHDRETSPNLRDGKAKIDKAICGGLSRLDSMVLGDHKMICKEIDESLAQTQSLGFVLGTGCVLPLTTPIGNIRTAIEYIRSQ